MTVTTTLDRQYFDGDGSNKVFPFNFRFFTNDQIYVSLIAPDGTITLQNLTTNYTLSGALQAGGGTVTMLVAPPLTVPATRVFIQRILPQVQPTSIRNQGKFYPEIHEDAFDRLTMLIQQALSGLSNSLQKAANGFGWDFRGLRGINVGTPVNGTDVATKAYVDGIGQGSNSYADLLNSKTVRTPEVIGSLPGAAARAGKFLVFDGGGNPAVAGMSGGPVTDAASVLYGRSKLDSAIITAKQMLDAQAVNIWEHAGSITSKPTADPDTWDWTPARVAAHAMIKTLSPTGGGVLVYPPGQYPHTQLIRDDKISSLGAGSGASYLTALPFNPGGDYGFIEIASGAVTSSHFKGFTILGSATIEFGAAVVNPTQWGMYIKAKWDAAYTHGGLWYSAHEDLRFGNFNRGIWSRGGYTINNYLRPNQWLTFDQVMVQLPTGAEAVRFTGQHGEIRWAGGAAEGRDSSIALRCLTFDYDPSPATMADNASGHGESTSDVAGTGNSVQAPLSMVFDGISMQKAQEGVFSRIATGNVIRDPYVENIGKFAQVQSGSVLHLDGGRFANAADGSMFGSAGNGYLFSLGGVASVTFGMRATFRGILDNVYDPAMNLNNIAGIVMQGGITGITAGKYKAAGFKSLGLTTSTIDVQSHRFSVVNSGADRSVKLTTVNSTAAPGETIFLRPTSGPITLGIGGNISLNGLTELTVPANGVLCLLRIPQVGGSGEWVVQSNPDHAGTSEPSNGYYYAAGTRIWRSNPSAGSFAGWMCTTAGLAGSSAVFKTMSNLAS